MSIKDELIKLNTTKQGIKDFLQEKKADLTNKTFSDTPELIRSVCKGDEVEAFALGEAKKAREGDKVILNYSADMVPAEAIGEDVSFKDATSNPMNSYKYLYVDRHRLCMATSIDTTYPLPVLLTRQSDGTYKYIKKMQTNSRYLDRYADFIPYGLFNIANTVYKLTPNNEIVRITSTNYIVGTMTYLNDFSLACTGGSKPKLLRNTGNEWEEVASLTGFRADSYYGCGLIDDKLLVRDPTVSDEIRTYAYDNTGATTLIGTSSIKSPNDNIVFWRFFNDGRKVIVGAGYNPSASQEMNLRAFNVTKSENGVYKLTLDTTNTEQLQALVLNYVGNLSNVIFLDEKTFFVWGERGLIYLEYYEDKNGSFFKRLQNPFHEYEWTGAFFVNPVDRIIAMQIDLKTTLIRFLDFPVKEDYVAETTEDCLFFLEKSLTGFVKEKKDISRLTALTVVKPNGVVPTYPDTFGLNVTVNAGHPAVTQTWAQPVLTSNGTLGIDDFAVSATSSYDSATQPYNCFSSNDSGLWASSSAVTEANPQYYTFYTTNPIAVKTIVMKNRSAYADEMLGNFVVQSSDDGEAWTDVATFENRNTEANVLVNFEINETSAHRYHRFKMTTTSAGISGRVSIGRLTIMAQEQTATNGGTIDISWGWFKSGNDYVKWNGTPPATLAHVEGNKARKMSLWLVKDGDATKPVISTLEPTSYTARHKVDDVYLSDTLDYFIEAPQSESEVDNV